MPIQRIADGKYRLWVSNGRGPDGKRLRYSRVVKAKDDKEATKFLAKFEKEVLKDDLPAPRNMTFKHLWEMYLRDHVDQNCAPKTKEWYEECGKRLLPAFGFMRVSAIQPAQVSAYYALLRDPDAKIGKLAGGLSPETVRHHHRALRAVMNFALRMKIIKDNPVNSIRTPKTQAARLKVYDETSLQTVLNALSNEPLKWYALIILAITTGCRREEIAGLRWADIDFIKKTIEINRAIQYIPKQGVIVGDTKTEESKRKISVPAAALQLLCNWKDEQHRLLQERYQALIKPKILDQQVLPYCETLHSRIKNFDDEYIWNDYHGMPMRPNTISHWWSSFVGRNNLPKVTLHGLRHTSVTISLASGADVTSVAWRHGHKDASVTLRVYAHALESTDRQISNMWDGIINREQSGTRVAHIPDFNN